MHLSDEQLSAYLDGELAPGEAQNATAHLGECASCASAVRLYTAVDRDLTAPPVLDCATASAFVSAKLDGELGGEESAMAGAHLASCADCREDLRRWSSADDLIAALPGARPSVRVDAAVAALGRRPVARVPRLGGAWAVPTMALATAISLIVVLSVPSGGPLLGRPDPGAVLLAAAQQSVLDPDTNTLYVLQPERGTVAAFDARTLVQKAVISVGGKPAALALDATRSAVLVLDSANKTVTEIDGSLTAVTRSTSVAVSGTPTGLQVDAKGNLVVTSVVPAPSQAPAAGGGATGMITTFVGDSKTVGSVRQVDVAPQVIVISPDRRSALLVSGLSTTLVDAETYAPLATAPGGIAAAFTATGDNFAVLSNGAAGATLTYARGGAVVIGGTPHAITSLPGGGFAVLADSAGRGVITLVAPDNTLSTLDAPPNARYMAYDANTRLFSVVGASGVASVPLPSTLTQVGTGPLTTGPANTPLPTPQTTAAPTATPAPTQSAVVVAPPEKNSLVPSGARAVWPGTYVVSLAALQRPTAAVSDGKRLWFLDRSNRVNALHMESGELNQIGALPPSAVVTKMAASPNHVYFFDGPTGALYVLTVSSEQIARVPLNLASNVSAVAASPDERLWLATGASGLVSYDPRNGQIEKVAVGADLSVVATDALGRVWTAAKDRQAIDVYDPLARKLTDISLAHGGAITALTVDRANTVWVGTDGGQTFALHSALAASVTGVDVANGVVGRPITGFALDPGGSLYFLSRSDAGLAYGTVWFPAGVRVSPASASEPMFDSLGRAWQADPAVGFYVTLALGAS